MRPVLVGLLVVGAVAVSAGQPTFRAGIDLVTFGVAVVDRDGAFVDDLTPDDLEVVEEGQRQTIVSFARGDGGTAPPLHLGLLFDTSGSMQQDLPLARSAAIRFLNTMTEAVDMTLVDFDTEVRVARYGQGDFPRLVERIRSRAPAGETALYDALGVYLDGASDDEGRTILVLYTDGGDTRSAIGFGDLMALVRASGVTIHAVGFLDNQSAARRAEQRARLRQIAEATGGQAFFPLSLKDVDEAYALVVAQTRAQYSVGFVSTNRARDGAWREVDIRVTRRGLRGAQVLARRGYFAPYGP